MRARVKDLFYEYCAPKPQLHIRFVDTDIQSFQAENQEEEDAIDVYCYLVV